MAACFRGGGASIVATRGSFGQGARAAPVADRLESAKMNRQSSLVVTFKSSALWALLAAFWCITGLAQPYPSRAVRFIVPFAPGGGTDILVRVLSPRLGGAKPRPADVVDNRPGAGSQIGSELVARAAAGRLSAAGGGFFRLHRESQPYAQDAVRQREGLHAHLADGVLPRRSSWWCTRRCP